MLPQNFPYHKSVCEPNHYYKYGRIHVIHTKTNKNLKSFLQLQDHHLSECDKMILEMVDKHDILDQNLSEIHSRDSICDARLAGTSKCSTTQP